MEEEKDPSPEYLRDFNDGYRIAENEKDVSDVLSKIDSNNSRISAMKAGVKTYNQEKSPARYPSWLKSTTSRDYNSVPDKQPPIKDIEPDR